MKIAWICYEDYHTDWDNDRESIISPPVILFYEPPSYMYERVIQIVYTEVVK